MDKIITQYFRVESFRTIPLKTMGVILLGLVFIIGVSACGTVKPLTDPAESKNLYPDNKPSIANVQTNPADKAEKADKQAILQKFMKLQMPFIANEGQIGKEVSFYAKTFGGNVYVTQKGDMIYSFVQVEAKDKATDSALTSKDTKGVTLKETLVGSSVTSPQGEDRAQAKVNYFIGNDKSKWKTDISTYNSISLGEVYKGIDLSLKAYGKTVEKVFTVQPDADPKNIKLKMEGAISIKVNDKGELELETDLGAVRFSEPVAYQERNGKRETIKVAYYLHGNNYGFKVDDYDTSFPLIIDPVLTWNTFMGSAGNDFGDSHYGRHIAVDSFGNVYVTGGSVSTWGPPITGGEYTGGGDAFAAKLNSSGELQWNTFMGSGSYDHGRAIAVDGSGNVYVAGMSDATWGSPAVPKPGGSDAFAAKLNSSGELQWNTFMGSGSTDYGESIALDGSGNVYVAGDSYATWGSPVAPKPGGSDAFAAKLNSSGELQWNTFMGSSGSPDYGSSIALDGSGNVYVGGESDASWGSPVAPKPGGTDAFVAKLNNSGVLQWNTFMGSGSADDPDSLAVDSSGNVYVSGETSVSWGSPVAPYVGGNDAFAAKLNSSGVLQWNTFLGSTSADRCEGIAVDGSGNVYLAGMSYSTWGSPANPHAGGGNGDAFAAKLNSSGELQWNTFMGSMNHVDRAVSIAVDGSGNVYVTGGSDATWGTPVNAHAGSYDVFVAKINQQVWYVTPTGAGLVDGTSWDNAFSDIDDAITAASAGDEIWVKAGTYLLSAEINVNKAVHVYGGFAGGETAREDRDWENNVTTIDGQATYRCFYVATDAMIDGFTITNGADSVAEPRGGAIWNNGGTLTITNCTFSGNHADNNDGGGAIATSGGTLTITNCIFSDGYAYNGGGAIWNSGSTLTITNCTFSANYAEIGGAIWNQNSSPTITNCTFSDNRAYSDGGSIRNFNSSPTIMNSTFIVNRADINGGAIWNANSSPTIINSTFSGNSAVDGGAIWNYNSSPSITNCILWGDTATNGPEIYDDVTSSPVVNYCNIEGGYPTGTGNMDADPLFVNPGASDFHLQAGSPCIDAGDNAAVPMGISIDFDGESRFIDDPATTDTGIGTPPIVDMGAYEYSLTDTDGDGMPDDWETLHFGDLSHDGTADEDIAPGSGDGLTDLEEYQNGTDPNNPDTDDDGLTDGDEVNIYGTDPLNPMTVPTQSGGILDVERAALIDLYNSTDGANWNNKDNWLGAPGTENTWYGVDTAYVYDPMIPTSHVIYLNLNSNNLVGTIPSTLGSLSNAVHIVLSDNILTGSIPTEIGNLTLLEYLWLDNNQLSGAIPPEIGNLSLLIGLILNDNQLSGTIPSEIGNLTGIGGILLSNNQLSGAIPDWIGDLSYLEILYLDGNQFSGAIPPEIGNLNNLQELHLNDNQLTGPIPAELGGLSALKRLYLYDNQLSGPIPVDPGLDSLSNLEELYLTRNDLDGSIPPELGNLTKLRDLRLESNQLTGSIPPELGNLTELQYLILDDNQLTGPIPNLSNLTNLIGLYLKYNQLSGPIPDLSNLTALTHLYLGENQLTGPFPDLSALINLQTLWLEYNPFDPGPIPVWIGDLLDLRNLRLGGNHLTGSIPSELSTLTKLVWLYLNNNQLEGTIPSWIGDFTVLKELLLNNNNFTGAIPPELGNLDNLLRLRLHHNLLEGEIPPELGTLSNLLELWLPYNQLSGTIPVQLGNLSNLQDLRLQENQLTGAIPAAIGNLINLQYLILDDNQLTGPIPNLSNLTNLIGLYLKYNQLSGPIPDLSNLTALTHLYLGENQLTGPFPDLSALINLQTLWLEYNPFDPGPIPVWIGDLLDLRNLRLGGNHLTESIPDEWSNLTKLVWLYLNNNQLEGTIPSWIGDFTVLKELLLNNNNFTGAIPPELGDLSELERIRLQNNQLSGAVPASFINLTSLINEDSDFCNNDIHIDTNEPGAEVLREFLRTKQIGQVLLETCQNYDSDGDGTPNSIDPDDDNDGLLDTVETGTGIFTDESNTGTDPLNPDSDSDGLEDGDEVAVGTNPFVQDSDGDTVLDGDDAYPLDASESADFDADDIGDNADNCPDDYNEKSNWTDINNDQHSDEQPDFDLDGEGNACDRDADNDGFISPYFPEGNDCDDLDPAVYPGVGDCEGISAVGKPPKKTDVPDADGDDVLDDEDNCPGVANPDQSDRENNDVGDGVGDVCDNCPDLVNPDQLIPFWYKDWDDDGYSDVDTEPLTQCERPDTYYKQFSELPGGLNDCEDDDPAVHPGPPESEIPNNQKDDDCNPDTPDIVQDYNIVPVMSGDADYSEWLPADGVPVVVDFTVEGPNGPVTAVSNAAGEVMVTDFSFTEGPMTSHSGTYTNDPREKGKDPADFDADFDAPVLDLNPNRISLTPRDFGGSIMIHAEVRIINFNGNQVTLNKDISFPKDADNDGLPDFWEKDYGNLIPSNDNDGDGLTNFEEYRGEKWGKLNSVAPNGIYKTVAYLPDNLPTHIRTNPTRRDLFVKFIGFDDAHPFAIGDAYNEAGIDVYALNAAEVASNNDYNIDVVAVTLAQTDVTFGLETGHIIKRGVMDYTFATLGLSSFGNDVSYGSNCIIYRTALDYYFSDKPYEDYTTFDGTNMRDQNAWGAKNGILDMMPNVEDKDDDGRTDGGEDKSGNGELDGDKIVRAQAGSDDPWEFNHDLSPFNINNDPVPQVELPVADTNYEYTKAQVLKHVITHEIGHNIGIVLHTEDPTCVMFNVSNNWLRDDHFSDTALELIMIHNEEEL